MKLSNDLKKDIESIFYMITITGALIGGCFWLANINTMATANTSDIKDLRGQEADHTKQFEEIRTRLTHIEDAVGAKRRRSEAP